MIKGIDISHWDAGTTLSTLNIDFAIFKLSEGIQYKDKEFDNFKKQAETIKMPWGFYHFARENDPTEEAYWFYLYSQPFYDIAVPILDYEVYNENDTEWCEKFLNTYHALTGKWCILYISASRCKEFTDSWIKDTCKLWVAGYPYKIDEWPGYYPPYDISPWIKPSIWQFASDFWISNNKYDANVCYDDTFTKKDIPDASLDNIVKKVINGEYGNGITRREKLKADGYDYQQVQNRVNDYFITANKVINGNYGNGRERKEKLYSEGYDYALVQQIVNDYLI